MQSAKHTCIYTLKIWKKTNGKLDACGCVKLRHPKIQGSYLSTQHFTKKSPGISGPIPSIFFGGIHTSKRQGCSPFLTRKIGLHQFCLPPSLRAMFRHYGHSEARLSAVSTAKPKKTAAAAVRLVTRGPWNRLVKSVMQSWWVSIGKSGRQFHETWDS